MGNKLTKEEEESRQEIADDLQAHNQYLQLKAKAGNIMDFPPPPTEPPTNLGKIILPPQWQMKAESDTLDEKQQATETAAIQIPNITKSDHLSASSTVSA